jgi:SAM-dependent methyltransferase
VSRRTSFDDVAALYDRARPSYPPALIEGLERFAGLGPESRVLEIGCGTAQLTVALARRGASVLAVELGPNLAALAATKLARYPRVEVVVADFDSWNVPDAELDLVVAATAFHWLDPATRLSKCLRALRPGGTLAIVETHWNAGSGNDPFFAATQDCYARWSQQHDPAFQPRTLETLPVRNDELEDSGRFAEIRLEQVVQEQRYRATEYCELLSTFSDIRALTEAARSGFLECIERLIDSRFGGGVARTRVSRLAGANHLDPSKGLSTIEPASHLDHESGSVILNTS